MIINEDRLSLSAETSDEVRRIWDIRRANFPDELYCDTPDHTLAISLTGDSCALNCAHCGGHYLEGMTPREDVPGKLDRGEFTSCLISGGCTPAGSVDVALQTQLVKNLRNRNMRINMHVGLISPEEIRIVAPLADRISFDFITDDETIHEVFGLSRRGQDYLDTYKRLQDAGAPVTPHICIGLKGGYVSGEYDALEQVARLGAPGVVFIVLIPTPGTRYSDRMPPALDDVAKIFARARDLFPSKPINLGCMRPQGHYRAELDKLAVRSGINRIVNPTPPALKLAAELGLELRYGRECCAL